MSARWRSASLGSQPIQKPKERSRAGSTAPVTPEVRCACQFFQSDTLLPDRINPVGSRSSSRADKSVEYYKSDYNTTLSQESLTISASIPIEDITPVQLDNPNLQKFNPSIESTTHHVIENLVVESKNDYKNKEYSPDLLETAENKQHKVSDSKMRFNEFIQQKLKQEEEARKMAEKPPQLFVSRLRDRSKDVYIPPQRSSTEESIIDDLDDLNIQKITRKSQSFRNFFHKPPKNRQKSQSLKHRARSRNKRQQKRSNSVGKRTQSFKSWLQKPEEEENREIQVKSKNYFESEEHFQQERKHIRRSSSFVKWLTDKKNNKTSELEESQNQPPEVMKPNETENKTSSWLNKRKNSTIENKEFLQTTKKNKHSSNQNINTGKFRSLISKKEKLKILNTTKKGINLPVNINLNVPEINITNEHGENKSIKKTNSLRNVFQRKKINADNSKIEEYSVKILKNTKHESDVESPNSELDEMRQIKESNKEANKKTNSEKSSFKTWFGRSNETKIEEQKCVENVENILANDIESHVLNIEDNRNSDISNKLKNWFNKKQDSISNIPIISDIKINTTDETVSSNHHPTNEISKKNNEIKTNSNENEIMLKNWFQKKQISTVDSLEQAESDKKPYLSINNLLQKKHDVNNECAHDKITIENKSGNRKYDKEVIDVATPQINTTLEQMDKRPVLMRPQSLERPGMRQYTQHRSRADERPAHKAMEHYDRPELRRAVMASPKRQLPSPATPIYVSGDGNDDYNPNARDHEYESIGEPDSETGAKSTSIDPKIEPQLSPSSSCEEKYPQSSTDHDEQIESDKELTVEEMQQQIEDKFFNKIDDVPTLPTILVQTPKHTDDPEKPAAKTVSERRKDMQRKFQNQAGKLKTKLQGIKKPIFNMPARKKAKISDETTTESWEQTKSKPIRKINLPDFKMSDRAKISMPEFKMPERPKISLPHFKMPDKSKFKFPDRPHLPDFKMPERPKMPDFKMPDFKMPDMPDLKIPNLKRHNSMKEPPMSSESTAESKKRIVFDFKTYPRIFAKKRDQEFVTSSPKQERVPIESATVPRAAARKKGPVGARWVNRFTDIKYVDDNDKRGDFEDRLHRLDEDYKQMQHEQEFEEDDKQVSPDSFNESMVSEEYSGHQNRYWADEVDIDRRDFDYGVKVDGQDSPSSNQEERGSSGESYEKHRIGVLEEIDTDEFFLRQRGISQDDIQVGKYLSSEIRDAFKTPINALEQLGSSNRYDDRDLDMNDYCESRDVDEDIDIEVSLTPLKPERTRSLRREKPQFETAEKSDELLNGFNTFPPNKPRRKKKIKKRLVNEEIPVYNVDLEFNDENDRNAINRNNFDNFERLLYENQMMEGKSQPEIMIVQDKLLNDINSCMYENNEFVTNINTYENEENEKNLMMEQHVAPKAPKRKRKRSLRDASASSEPGSIINAQFQDDWPSLSQLPADIDDEVIVHRVQHEYIIPLAESEQFPSPTPPRRTRSRSLTSRATTGPDEDRTSHGAESLASDNQSQDKEITRNILDLQDGSGYAIVRRTPSVPKRRKRVSKSAENRPGYQTTPRMREPPPRPPPRRQSEPDLRENSPDITQYEEVEDEDKNLEELISGNIINKMKDRPLPAPPRPPRAAKRKKKKNLEQMDNIIGESNNTVQEINLARDYRSIDNLEDEIMQRQLVSNVAAEVVDNIIHTAELQFEQTNTDEQEMWTQTDPLPDDIICDENIIQQDEVILKDIWKDHKSHDNSSFSTIERNKDDSKKHIDDSIRSSLDPVDVERARKIADAESLTRGLRRFRETSQQRTFSSSRTPSERAMSEHALLLERTLVSPTKTEGADQLLTQATLLVKPVDDDLDIDDLLEEEAREERKKYLNDKYSYDEVLSNYGKGKDEQSYLEDIDMQQNQERSQNLGETIDLHEAVTQHEVMKEPPIPMRRRGSLKKSRSIPTDEFEKPDLKPEATGIEHNQAESTSTEVEILKTNRLQVSNLDVENLNVSQLQASSITVSEVDGIAMHVKELNSKSGNLVVSGIDIAPTVIQEIIDRLTPTNMHNTAQISTQTDETIETSLGEKKENTQETQYSPPTTVQIDPNLYFSQNPYIQQGLYYPNPASIPPASFYTLRPPDFSEEEVHQIHAVSKGSRRRHMQKKESTSEEEQQETQIRHRRVVTRSPEPSIQEITGQLMHACCNSVQRNAKYVWNVIRSKTNTEEHKREIQIALIILLVFTAGLIMIALSDNKTVHHHHWEFFNPPSDKNA